MTTTIRSNGSKWAGEQPDPIDALMSRLARYTLCRDYNGFENVAGGVRFWGNFMDLSAVFDIETDDPAIAGPLQRAIRANRQTAAYRSQPSESQRRIADKARWTRNIARLSTR